MAHAAVSGELPVQLRILRGPYSERKREKQREFAGTRQRDRTAGIQPTLESKIT